MTDPEATVPLFAVVIAPVVRLANVSVDCATACVALTTFGTVTRAGPSDTTSDTALPVATLVPAAGLSLITDPAAIVELFAVVTVPVIRLAAVIAACAFA